jgi:serine/threonine-protein kinase
MALREDINEPAAEAAGRSEGRRAGEAERPAKLGRADTPVLERARALVGRVLKGKWRLERVVGVGGMATVYAAVHRNQSRVAIKMLHPEVALDSEVTSRFLREGYMANAVGHPGTVAVLDDDVTEEGVPFLVMELLQGETLEARWSRKGEKLPISEVLPVIDQLLEVLAAAHDKGVVHRDLKPENLFLTADGRLKVLDFGIARLREVSNASGSTTRVGSLLGTPAFMAPEQARGRWDDVDGATDLWAVGATLFTLLTGRLVHEAETLQEQLVLAATTKAPSISRRFPELAPALVEVIDRALAFDKCARWPNAREMRAGLRAAMASVADEVAFSLPRPSLRDETNPTLVAPPELTSAITGHSPDTLTTARPFMRDRSSAPPSRSRFIALVLAGTLLGGAAAAIVATQLVTPDNPQMLGKQLAVRPDLTAFRRGTDRDVPAPPVAPTIDDPRSGQKAAQSSPTVHVAARKGGPHVTPRLEHKKGSGEPTVTAPPPAGSGNPFDKRH